MDTKEQQIRLLYYWLEKERRKRIVRLLLSEILVLAGIGIVFLGGSGSALLGSASFAGLILLFYLLVADPPMSAERMERVSSAIQQGKFASQNAFPTKWGPPPRLVWWAYRMLYKAETPLLEGKVFSSTTLQQLNGANEVDAEEMSYNEANEALFVYGMQLIGHPETGYSVSSFQNSNYRSRTIISARNSKDLNMATLRLLLILIALNAFTHENVRSILNLTWYFSSSNLNFGPLFRW